MHSAIELAAKAAEQTTPHLDAFTGQIAVIVPCYNEAVTIGKVVRDFRAALPNALIFVYDNNSTDGTYEQAAAAGAIARRETRQGKGNVVRRMFADVEAEIYVMVDGDATYDAFAVPKLIEAMLSRRLDMVNGRRISTLSAAYRPGHRFGNWLLTTLVAKMFGKDFRDMLSGLRVFSRRFVKSFPALSSGFEIETELTVHALDLRMPIAEIDVAYGERPEGSFSKLNTIRDGIRILRTIITLVREERPMLFFGVLATMLFLAALGLGLPVVVQFLETGLVPRLPTAVLASSCMLLSWLCGISGLILHTVTLGRLEAKRMFYLSIRAP